MATTKDSNKLTIYKGEDEDYAFIPLTFTEDSSYKFTNSIIYNDGSTYIKNITSDSELYKLVKDKLLDASAPAIRDKQEDPKNPTISINDGTYNINGYLANKMLTHIIKLYYIENFKYTLDVSQYTAGDDENTNVVKRGNTYMFTIIPKLTTDVSVLEASQSEDPNKKYDIKFSVDRNQTLTLTRIGATNNYILGGTLVIKYDQSDNSIKGDYGTISTITNNNNTYTFLIYLGSVYQQCTIQKIDGYNTLSNLWEGKININLDETTITYTNLKPGTTTSCELHMKISKDVPIFSKHGSRLNLYVAQGSDGMDNSSLYKFKINNIFIPNKATVKAYFLQSTLGYYKTWVKTVNMVMNLNDLFIEYKVSGIFIIITDNDEYISDHTIISNKTYYADPNQLLPNNINIFKQGSTDHNSIFTSPINNGNPELDGPPIFLYDENNKQTKIDQCETDNNIFKDEEKYFKYNSGNEFTVSIDHKKNIINLNKYKHLMYEYINIKPDHYCDKQLTNADLSAYEGETKTFNVVYEVWSRKKSDVTIINAPAKNSNDDLVLMANRPSYELNNGIDTNESETVGGSTVGGSTVNEKYEYTDTVTMYKLYSFKLSKTDSTTGVYEYTFTD